MFRRNRVARRPKQKPFDPEEAAVELVTAAWNWSEAQYLEKDCRLEAEQMRATVNTVVGARSRIAPTMTALLWLEFNAQEALRDTGHLPEYEAFIATGEQRDMGWSSVDPAGIEDSTQRGRVWSAILADWWQRNAVDQVWTDDGERAETILSRWQQDEGAIVSTFFATSKLLALCLAAKWVTWDGVLIYGGDTRP